MTTTAKAPAPKIRDVPAWVAWLSVAVAAAVTAFVVRGSTGPAYPNDEVATMANALAIAQPSIDWNLGGGSYMPGTALLLAPIWWITNDPGTAFRTAIAVLGVLSVAVILPISRIARHLGTPRHLAVVLGAIVAVAPEHALLANYAWSEQLLAFTVACAAWAGLAAYRRTTVLRLTAFAGVAAAEFLVHGRSMVFAAVLGLAVVALAWRARDTWLARARLAAAPVATYLIVVVGSRLLYSALVARMYPVDRRTQKTLESLANQSPADLAAVAAGQAWYLLVVWAGLGAIGVLALVSRARRGELVWPARWLAAALGAQLLFITLVLSGVVDGQGRTDLYVYGRYFAPFAMLIVTLGLVAVTTELSRRHQLIAGAAIAVTSAAVLLVTVPRLPVGGEWAYGHIPGIGFLLNPRLSGTDTLDDWRWIVGLVAFAAGTIVFIVRSRVFALTVVAAYFIGVTMASDAGPIRDHEDHFRTPSIQARIATAVDEDVPLALDRRLTHVLYTENAYMYWSHPRLVLSYYPGRDERPSPMVLSTTDWPEARERGALPLQGSLVGSTIIWVFPGELQDELLALDLLALPVTADEAAAES